MTPVLYAARSGKVDVLKHMMSLSDGSGEDGQGRTIFHLACVSENVDCVSCLLLKGFNPDVYDKAKEFPLFIACKKGLVDIARTLVRASADASAQDINGMTCMHAAARAQNLEICQLLSSIGCDEQLKMVDKSKRTPLFMCIENTKEDRDNKELVSFLLSKGSNPSAVNVEYTSILHMAVQKCNADVVSAIIKAGADPNEPDKKQNFPLHLASNRGNVSVVEALLKCGASPNTKNSAGETGLSLAVASKKKEIIIAFANHESKN